MRTFAQAMERLLARKATHLKELQALGYIESSLYELTRLEDEAHAFAERACNESVDEAEQDKTLAGFERRLAALFGGKAPQGAFINLDPRGYTLKLDDEAYAAGTMPLSYRDFGGYGILAPEFVIY